jgi:hypothetical protein
MVAISLIATLLLPIVLLTLPISESPSAIQEKSTLTSKTVSNEEAARQRQVVQAKMAARAANYKTVEEFVPYWKIGEGFDSTIVLNNVQPRTIEVTPLVFDSTGHRIPAKTVTVRDLESVSVRLGDLIDNVNGYGYIGLQYMGIPMDIAAQMIISNQAKSIAFNDLFMGMAMSTTLEGVFFLPKRSTNASIAIADLSDAPADVHITFKTSRDRRLDQVVTVSPHQMQLLDVNSILGTAPEDRSSIGVSIDYSGKAGDIAVQGMLADPNGFSANMRFVDPMVLKSTRLFSPALRINDSVTAITVLSNITAKDVTVQLIGHYTLTGEPYQVPLQTLNLRQQSVALVDLSSALQAIPLEAAGVGLEISHDDNVGGIVADVLLIDSSGSQVYQAAPKDTVGEAALAHTFPFRIDGDLDTIVTIANPSPTDSLEYSLFVFYDGDNYGYNGAPLKPGEIKQIDIRELRDKRTSGRHGEIIPGKVISGQVKLKVDQIGNSIQKEISESVIFDPGLKMSMAMSCAVCPPDGTGIGLTAYSVSGQLTDQSSNIGVVMYYSDSTYRTVSPIGVIYYSDDSSIANASTTSSTTNINFYAVGVTNVYLGTNDYTWYQDYNDDCIPTQFAFYAAVQTTSGCGDDRGNIIKEYRVRSTDWVPNCSDFVSSMNSTYFTTSEYNYNGYHTYFIAKSPLTSGADATRISYGAALTTTAGYRCPDKQNDINPSAVVTSRHHHGDAMDWSASNSDTVWANIKTAAKANSACVEPLLNSSNNHVHSDWRGSCPSGW